MTLLIMFDVAIPEGFDEFEIDIYRYYELRIRAPHDDRPLNVHTNSAIRHIRERELRQALRVGHVEIEDLENIGQFARDISKEYDCGHISPVPHYHQETLVFEGKEQRENGRRFMQDYNFILD